MANYYLSIYCANTGSRYLTELAKFIKLFCEHFSIANIFNSRGLVVDCTEEGLETIYNKLEKRLKFPGIGVDFDLFSRSPKERSSDTIKFEIHTGVSQDSNFINFFHVDLGNAVKSFDTDIIKKIIQIFNPIELYIAETANEFSLDTFNIQQSFPQRQRPAIIRNIHYLDESLVESVGGKTRILGLPFNTTERVGSGILLQILNEPFDNENKSHRDKQLEIHKMLNLL